MVAWLLTLYLICFNHCYSNTKASLELIVALKVLKRLEIDLVDIRLQREGNLKWIQNAKDYFSIYTTLNAMSNKKASTIVQFLYMFILHCGIPDII